MQSTINNQLVDAILQMISALSKEEQTVLVQRLVSELPEPDIYTAEDGEPIE